LADFYEIGTEGDFTLLLRSRSDRLLAVEELANVTLRAGSSGAGLGPFVLDSLSPEGIRLHSFPLYFAGAPAVAGIDFQVYRSQRAAWTGMMRDEIDALYEVNRDAVEFVEKESRVRTYSFLRPYVSAVIFNVSQPVFRDRNVRRGLAAAVSRSAVVSSAYRGRALAAHGPIAPTYWALSDDLVDTKHNRDLAMALLASHRMLADSGEMPARVRFRCLVPAFETQPLERIALIIQKQLYDFGVNVQLEQVSVRELLPRIASGDFEAVLMEFFAVTPSWLSSFWHSPLPGAATLIQTGYSAADRELDAMDSAATEEELRHALAAVYRRMAEDPPAIFIAWPQVTRAVSTRFDVPVEKGRDIMGANLWLWRPAKQP
jgi:peptide/nickel transport system substrate-binding protein